MSGETTISIVGNLTAPPELRYTQSGTAVVNFTIASTPRTFDKQANEWRDGQPLFMRCSAWRDTAEHIAASLEKGARVVAQGRLVQRSWESKEGEKRSSVELEVEEIGPSLRYATATVTRANGSGRSQEPRGEANSAGSGGWATQGQNAPQWAAGGAAAWNSGADDTVPF